MSGLPAVTTGLSGRARLALAAGAVALLWLVVLPRIARLPPVDRHLRAMEEGEVNAAAMVYTELERIPTRREWVERHLVLWP